MRLRLRRRMPAPTSISYGGRPMTAVDPSELAAQLGAGLLSFPVTHFDADGDFDESAYRQHLTWLAEHDVAGLFAAGGTGEYFSLTPQEVTAVVSAAVSESASRVPIVAPAGGATRVAVDQTRAAERAGASGVMLLPPYLTEASQEGLVERASAVCRSTSLGIIYYNRANGILRPDAVEELAERHPNFVALKDGVGDLELMTRIHARSGSRLAFIGGLPTAELFALPYLALGATTYSSAMFNFLPRFALEFYAAVRRGDHDAVAERLRTVVLPYVAIRDPRAGYAVAIVKAGMSVIGRAVVMPDADVEFAANQIVSGAFGSAGERCMAVPVAVAVGDAAEPLISALKAAAERIRVGPGSAPGTDMGPVISGDARERVRNLATEALGDGATAVLDGRDIVVEDHEGGFFIGPTILDRVSTAMKAYSDEVFGPLLVVMRVDTFDQALDLVNSSSE